MNMLRADVWRLVRTKMLPGVILLLIACATVVIVLDATMGITVASPRVYQLSVVDNLANNIWSPHLLTMAVTWPGVWLIVEDFKNGAFKTLLAEKGARTRYLLSKLALAVVWSVLFPGFGLAVCAVVPALFGLTYAVAATPVELVCWWALAALVLCAYAMLAQLAALVLRRETLAWVACFLIVFTLAEMALVRAVGFFSEPAAALVYRCLPLAVFSLVSVGAAPFAEGIVTAEPILIPLAWALAAAALAYAAFRRRTL